MGMIMHVRSAGIVCENAKSNTTQLPSYLREIMQIVKWNLTSELRRVHLRSRVTFIVAEGFIESDVWYKLCIAIAVAKIKYSSTRATKMLVVLYLSILRSYVFIHAA